jgi:hypothetical protein
VRGLTTEREDVAGIVARVSAEDTLNRRERASLLGRLARALAASAREAGGAGVASGRWLTDLVVDVAPHLPVRDLPTLRAHYRGLSGDALAEALIATASRSTAAVGAAGGALASVEFAAPPTLLSAPVQVAAETLAVVAIEIKLVAELHEVYGRAPVGTSVQRAAAYLGAWGRRRGIDPFAGPAGLTTVISGAARRELRQRVLRRAGRNLTTLGPFLTGAVAGAELNRRETRRLGERVQRDLLPR